MYKRQVTGRQGDSHILCYEHGEPYLVRSAIHRDTPARALGLVEGRRSQQLVEYITAFVLFAKYARRDHGRFVDPLVSTELNVKTLARADVPRLA
jgi:hypothetical protein